VVGVSIARVRSHPESAGFTLIELMIGLILLAILLGVAVPAFRTFILDQRLRAASNDLNIALITARSEAVKRNRAVSVVALDDDDWSTGWVVPSPVPGDPDILTHIPTGQIVVTKETNPGDPIVFGPAGRVLSAGLLNNFEIVAGTGAGAATACVRLRLDGRIEYCKQACPFPDPKPDPCP